MCSRKTLNHRTDPFSYPVKARGVSEQLVMGHFTTVSRAMKFYDQAEGIWMKEKLRILKFIGLITI